MVNATFPSLKNAVMKKKEKNYKYIVGHRLYITIIKKLSDLLQKSPLVSKELNTKQLVENTFWLKPWLNKKVNFIWLQLFPFG